MESYYKKDDLRKYAMFRVIMYLSRNNTVMEEGAEYVGLMNTMSNLIVDDVINDVIGCGYGVLETKIEYIEEGEEGIEVDFLKLTDKGRRCLDVILESIDLSKTSTN